MSRKKATPKAIPYHIRKKEPDATQPQAKEDSNAVTSNRYCSSPIRESRSTKGQSIGTLGCECDVDAIMADVDPRLIPWLQQIQEEAQDLACEAKMARKQPDDKTLMQLFFKTIPAALKGESDDRALYEEVFVRLHHGLGKDSGDLEAKKLSSLVQAVEISILQVWDRVEALTSMAGCICSDKCQLPNYIQAVEEDLHSTWAEIDKVFATLAVYERAFDKIESWLKEYPDIKSDFKEEDASNVSGASQLLHLDHFAHKLAKRRIQQELKTREQNEATRNRQMGAVFANFFEDCATDPTRKFPSKKPSQQNSHDEAQLADKQRRGGKYLGGKNQEKYERRGLYLKDILDNSINPALSTDEIDFNCKDDIRKIITAYDYMVYRFIRSTEHGSRGGFRLGSNYGTIKFWKAMKQALLGCSEADTIASTSKFKPPPGPWGSYNTSVHYAGDYLASVLGDLRLFTKMQFHYRSPLVTKYFEVGVFESASVQGTIGAVSDHDHSASNRSPRLSMWTKDLPGQAAKHSLDTGTTQKASTSSQVRLSNGDPAPRKRLKIRLVRKAH